jgi:hypothetical protein
MLEASDVVALPSDLQHLVSSDLINKNNHIRAAIIRIIIVEIVIRLELI